MASRCLLLPLLVALACAAASSPLVLRNPAREAQGGRAEKLVVGAPNAVSMLDQGAWDWLNKLLAGFQMPIDNQHFEKSDFVFDLTGLRCSDFSIGQLTASFEAPNMVNFEVVDVRTTCTGDFRYVHHGFPHFSDSGHMKASITRSSLTGTITLGYNQALQLPESASVSSCTADTDVSVDFWGGGSAEILDMFKSSVEDALRKNLNQEACDDVRREVTNMQPSLAKFIQKAEPYLVTPTPTPTPSLPPLRDLRQDPVYTAIDENALSLITASSVNSLVRAQTNGTNSVTVPFELTKSWASDVLKASVWFHTVSVGDLVFKTMDLFDASTGPADGSNLHTEIAMDKLTLEASMLLKVGTNAGQATNNVTLAVSLQNPSIVANQIAAVPATSQKGGFHVCPKDWITTLNVTNIAPTFDAPPTFSLKGYDQGFDNIITQSLDLAFSLVQGAVPLLLANLADYRARTSINAQLTQLLSKGCDSDLSAHARKLATWMKAVTEQAELKMAEIDSH